MRKHLLLILAIFAFSFAQAQGFKFGVKGGVNYSTLSGSDRDNTVITTNGSDYTGTAKYKWGWHGGLSALYEFDDFWGVKIDALYTTKGYQFKKISQDYAADNVGGTVQANVKRSINYVSVPVLLNINAGGLYFELGPEFAYMTDSKAEVKTQRVKSNGDDLGNPTTAGKNTSNSDLQNFDFGYVGGIGYQGKIVGFGVRYNGGFTNISSNQSIRNSVFMATLSFMCGKDTFGGMGGGDKAKTKIKE